MAIAHTLVSPFGTLNADTICHKLFACLFLFSVMWVSKSLKGVNSIGCEIHFGCWLYPPEDCLYSGGDILLTFKVKALIQAIARFLITRVRISTKLPQVPDMISTLVDLK